MGVKIKDLPLKSQLQPDDYFVVDNGTGTYKTPQDNVGTKNYNDLSNKPKINNVELSGNKSASDLGLVETSELSLKADKTQTNETDRRLKNLYELTQGQVWDFETDNVDENLHTIPSGVKAGSLKKIYGNTMAINQVLENGNFETINGWTPLYCSLSAQDNILTATVDTVSSALRIQKQLDIEVGHKYFVSVEFNPPRQTRSYVNVGGSTSFVQQTMIANQWNLYKEIITPTNTDLLRFYFNISDDSLNIGDICKVRDFNLIDLTDIENATGLTFTTTTDVENYLKKLYGYIPSYIPYQENTLLDFNSKEIEIKGINQWGEQWELGNYSEQNGGKISSTTKIRNKYKIPVFPNQQIRLVLPSTTSGLNAFFYDYNETYIGSDTDNWTTSKPVLTIPKNCYYLNFSTYGTQTTSYDYNISINYPSTDTSYHPYVEKQSIPIPSSVLPLRQARNVRDEYVNGLKTQKVAILRLNVDDMNSSENYPGWNNSGVRAIIGANFNNVISNAISDTVRYVFANTNSINDLLYFDAVSSGMTQSEWKQNYPGKIITFFIPLATPIETTIDLSDTFKEYNMEGNGTLEGISDVPSSNTKYDIEYIVKLDESVGA